MRALRRIATPASVAVAIGGCSYPFDNYLPQQSDAGLTTNATSTPQTPEDTGVNEPEDTSVPPRDSGVFDTAVTAEDSATEDTNEPDTFVVTDTAETGVTCKCVKYAGVNCKEWSPPGCGD